MSQSARAIHMQSILSKLFLLVGPGLMLWSVWLVVQHAYAWLRFGIWPTEGSLAWWCNTFGCREGSWARMPEDWVGLHGALMDFPAAGSLFVVGVVVWVISAAAYEDQH